LQVGQTFSTVISNPTTRTFFRGYTIVLSTGSDNIAYGQVGQQISVGCFEYGTFGNWSTSAGLTSLFDTDTSTNGMQVDITLSSTNTFHAVMTPLGNPANAYSTDGALENKKLTDQGEVNWVTYQLYNTDSNFYPDLVPCGGLDRTDFYIKSMTIAGFPLKIQKAGANVVLSRSTNVPGFNLESTPSLSAPVWSPVSPSPLVVNDQNVVTNSIAGAQQYYRLRLSQ
jgi:hypothetical protein